MTEQELLDDWRAMMPAQLSKVQAMPEGYLEINDPDIIKAAWGPRITSSRTRGMDLSPYPESVGAVKAMWIDWMIQDGPQGESRQVKVVIAKKKAQARIDAALRNSGLLRDPETIEAEPVTPITPEEIDDMLQERAELRAARRFEEADKIRDYLLSHGVTVSDARVAH